MEVDRYISGLATIVQEFVDDGMGVGEAIAKAIRQLKSTNPSFKKAAGSELTSQFELDLFRSKIRGRLR